MTGALLPVDVQMRSDAETGAAIRRAEAACATAAGYLRSIERCGPDAVLGQPHWHAFMWRNGHPDASGEGTTIATAADSLTARLAR